MCTGSRPPALHPPQHSPAGSRGLAPSHPSSLVLHSLPEHTPCCSHSDIFLLPPARRASSHLWISAHAVTYPSPARFPSHPWSVSWCLSTVSPSTRPACRALWSLPCLSRSRHSCTCLFNYLLSSFKMFSTFFTRFALRQVLNGA